MPIDATIMQVAIILTGLTLANAKRDSIAVSMTDILSSFSDKRRTVTIFSQIDSGKSEFKTVSYSDHRRVLYHHV